MATIRLILRFSNEETNFTEEADFDLTSGIADYVDEAAEEILNDRMIGYDFDGYEEVSVACDDWAKEWGLDDFDDLADFGEWADCFDEHGEAAELRFADWDGYDADTVMEGYNGCWDSAEKFAQQQHEDMVGCNGFTDWPYSCIDWEHAARELMYDFSSYDGDDGIHIWRE